MAAIKSWVDYDLTIYEPASTPYYRITYVVNGRRKQSSGGTTLKDAEKRVRELKAELDGATSPTPGAGMTLGELLIHYVDPDHHLGWGVRHAQEQERFVRLHVRPHLNVRKDACDLNAADFELILSKRLEATSSRDTLNSDIQKCRTLVTHARRHAGLQTDPMDGLASKARRRLRQTSEIAAADTTATDGVHVSGDLDRRIPSAAMADDAAKHYAKGRQAGDVLTADERELEIRVSRFTGIRPGERHALTAGQCAQDGSSIVVDRTLAEASGRKWIKPPKNGQKRDVAVPPPIRRELAARRARAIAEGGPDALMFPAPRGGHWSRSNFSRKFGPAMQSAGWADGQSLRDLRHLYAVTALGDWGFPLEVVSGELGHHSPEFTSRRYLSRQQGYRDAMEATFDRLEWGAS